MRVYKFAKELGKDSGDFVHELQSNFGFDIKSHFSGITEEQMQIRMEVSTQILEKIGHLMKK